MNNHISDLRKSGIDFSVSVQVNQPRDLSCANIVEMDESDPTLIPDISRQIFFVILDYELVNPVLIR
jgi:hypothetical protein